MSTSAPTPLHSGRYPLVISFVKRFPCPLARASAGGRHPFGDNHYERDANILRGQPRLGALAAQVGYCWLSHRPQESNAQPTAACSTYFGSASIYNVVWHYCLCNSVWLQHTVCHALIVASPFDAPHFPSPRRPT